MSGGTAEKLTALEHLQELVRRLLAGVAVVFVGAIAAYVWRQRIIEFIQQPLHEQLYYTSPMGSFQFVMQVCMLCGAVLALPIIIYNLLRYIEPVFTKSFSHKFVILALISSTMLAAAGVAFAYYLTLPFALKFFTAVGGKTLTPLISINEYFSFILGYLATFAVIFQLPLLLLFINYVTPFKPGGLSKWRRHVYIGAFGVSLVMPSSPDPLSQVSLAIPIIILYELSVVLIWRVNRKRHRTLRFRQAAERRPQPRLASKPVYRPVPAQSFSSARVQQARQVEQHELSGLSTEAVKAVRPVQATVRRDFQQPITQRTYTTSPQPARRLISDIL